MRIGIALLLFAALPLLGQEDHGLTPADIERGGQIFLTNCASCHGPYGDGVSGVNLASNKFRRASTERELIGIIQNGIPGTPMPPGNYTDQVAMTIAGYLHSMARSAPAVLGGVKGDAARGKSIVEGKGQCLGCHRIDGNGSFLGPDLSEIGASRRVAEIERSLLEPDAEIRADNRTVWVTRTDGTVIAGARLLNQDTDTVQVIDGSGKLISLRRTDLREFEIQKNSPMPPFKDRLSAQELADTVSYLVARKGSAETASLVPARADDPRNWLTYSGALNGQRYSKLNRITTANAKNLELKWVVQARPPAEPAGKYEATSLVVDGVLYTVEPPNVVVAMDAATGRIFWTYAYNPAPAARLCCGRVNRGLAILGNTLFMGTIDGKLMALDARDGHPTWTVSLGRPEAGY